MCTEDLVFYIGSFNIRRLNGTMPPNFDQPPPEITEEAVFGYDEKGRLGLYVPVTILHPDNKIEDTFFTVFQQQVGQDDLYICGGNPPFNQGEVLSKADLDRVTWLFDRDQLISGEGQRTLIFTLR
jgi:hypothetical protein